MSRFTAIAGLLTFGTLCSLFAKLIYYAEGANRYGKVAKFEKPWFQVLAVRFPAAPLLGGFHCGRFFASVGEQTAGRFLCVGRCRPRHLLVADAGAGLPLLWSL